MLVGRAGRNGCPQLGAMQIFINLLCLREKTKNPSRQAAAKEKGAESPPLCDQELRKIALPYQGTIFRRPFFFLLLDSFEALSSALCVPSVLLASVLCEPSVAAAAAFAGCSLPVPAAGASGFAGCSLPAPAVAAFPEGSVAGGVAGAVAPLASPAAGGCVDAGAAASGAGVTSAAGAAPPGVTVSTTAVLRAPPGPPSCDLLPPLKMSMPEASDSGSRFGAPFFADATISLCGPERTRASGFFTKPSRCRGALCSAVIHATALGSGCGTGTLNATNLFFAFWAKLESG